MLDVQKICKLVERMLPFLSQKSYLTTDCCKRCACWDMLADRVWQHSLCLFSVQCVSYVIFCHLFIVLPCPRVAS